MISGDSEAALDFLKWMHPLGPWVITTIAPDRKGIETRTFVRGCEPDALAFIQAANGRRNLYFSTNTVLRPIHKKASREDILRVDFLHCDVDPRAGEDLQSERHRICAMLTSPPAPLPPPSIVVFSGGGYQAFWRLKDPIPINGDLTAAAEVELYNKGIELALGGDHTHDICRIMRLPYTVNLPDERKTQKGRTPELAVVVERHDNRVYSLADFTPAPVTRSDQTCDLGRPGQSSRALLLATPVERFADLEALERWRVPERIKVIIAQGSHPDEKTKTDCSRSEWLFDVVCQLVRCEVPDAVVFSIITDPLYAISESVLQKGARAEKYALRQIERAKQFVINPALLQLNERHFVIENEGGKCRVAEWLPTDDGRDALSLQTFEDFRNRYSNRFVPMDDKVVAMGKWWLGQERRRQFCGLVFRPGAEQVVDGYLNLWRGFSVDAHEGDWSLMQEHIREVLAGGDIGAAEYITRWAAWAVQNPAQPAEVALVLQGSQGTGKSTFGRALKSLFGQHGLQVTAAAQFAGRFNSHLRDVCLLFADEAVRPDDRQAKGILKALLTEPHLASEAKGRDIIQVQNHVKVVMASNEKWIVPVELSDR